MSDEFEDADVEDAGWENWPYCTCEIEPDIEEWKFGFCKCCGKPFD